MAIQKPWGGRFEDATHPAVEAFTQSLAADRQIALDDVEGSLAHIEMLGATKIVSAPDVDKIRSALFVIRDELKNNTFAWNERHEDVHMNIEARLSELVGSDVSGRLHTARSRNDQVALDERLFLRRRLRAIRSAILDLEEAIVTQGNLHVGTLLPGYTHLQRAQPMRLAHHLLAHREALARDRTRIDDALARAMECPLGSGALSGTTHPIDRWHVAHALGFARVTQNSIDAVSQRDALLEAMSCAAISMVHLSRIAEELVLWTSAEFGFAEIGDAFTTGSSMMPQKKNPDVAELVRGKAGRVIGDLVSLLVVLKGLPLAYNRDLQEDKPALIDALDTWEACLVVMKEMFPSIRFCADRMKRALVDGFVLATELADHLVERGIAFREAHEVVGRTVAACVASDRRLEDLSPDEFRGFHPAFGDDVRLVLDPERALERRDVEGGPARARVEAALLAARDEIARARTANP